METLVATVLIVVVFMMASMVLNNVFGHTILQNTKTIEYELARLQYLNAHGKLELPHYDTIEDWSIEVSQVDWKGEVQTIFSASHASTKKEVEYKVVNE